MKEHPLRSYSALKSLPLSHETKVKELELALSNME
jgi:hypothetical protein